MATKPPYVVNQRLKQMPHQDISLERINYKDGREVWNTLYNVFVNNDTSVKYYTSQSTKPWPNGKPPVWTNQNRSAWRFLADSANGYVIWVPGSAWPQVSSRRRSSTGGYGHVFKPPVWRKQNPDWPSQSSIDNKIRNELMNDFNAGVCLAEVKKSVDGVAKRLSTILFAALDVKRGRLDLAARRLGYPRKKKLNSARRRTLKREIVDPKFRQFASDWLELQYGWKPLIQDIYAGVDYMKNNHPPTRFIETWVTLKEQLTYQYTSPSNIDGGTGVHYETFNYKTRKKYTVEYQVDDVYIKRLSETGLLNPALVAWELVPFSFVVDWFLPIGDYLSALTANCGVSIKGCLYSEKYVYTRSITSSLRGNTSADTASGTGYFAAEGQTYSRTNKAFPSAKLPSFKNPISPTHCANALALVVSIFSNGKGFK